MTIVLLIRGLYIMKKILIIEDEDMVREELKTFLENNGFAVTAPQYIPTEMQICSEKNLSRIRKRLEGTSLTDFVRTIPRKGYVVGKE